MKRSQRGALLSFLIIGATFFALSVVLHSRTFHRYLLALFEKGNRIEISCQDSEVKILRGVFVLTGLEIRDLRGRFTFQTDRLFANLSPLSAIRGKFIVSDLVIDKPSLSLRPTEGPKQPLAKTLHEALQKFEESLLLQNVILDKIVFNEMTLKIGEKPTYAVKKVLARIAPTVLREISLSLNLEEASAISPLLNSFQLDVKIKKEHLKVEQLALASSKISLLLAGEAKGELEKGEFKINGSLEAPTVLSEPLNFTLSGRTAGPDIDLHKIEARLGDAHLEGKGEINRLSRRYRLTFSAEKILLESIFGKLSSEVLGPARGVGEAEGQAQGVLPAIHAEANARIRDFRHTVLAAREAKGKLSLHWPHLDFDADVKPGEEGRTQAHVGGGVTFKRLSEKEKLQTVLRTLDLKLENASLKEILPDLKVSGQLDGTLHLVGAQGTSVQGEGSGRVTDGTWVLGKIKHLDSKVTFRPGGKITFQETHVEIPAITEFTWPGPIHLETSGESVRFTGEPVTGLSLRGFYEKASDRFRIESLRVHGHGSSLNGSLDLSTDGRIDARLKGTSNLEWLLFLPAFFREGSGPAQVDLAATGTFHEPFLRGKVEFLGNELEIRGLPQGISALKGILTIDGTVLKPNLSGELGDGQFLLKGIMKLAQWKPEELDLSLLGRNLNFFRPNVYRIDFDADVSLKGRLPSPRLEGRIDIVDGRYTKNFVVHELIIKPFEEPSEPAEWEKTVKDMEVRLAVRNSGDLRVNNNVAAILLRSDLQVGGTYGHPRIEGSLTTLEGVFHYLGEDFVLTEGRLEFLDPLRREPYLLLTAQQEVPPDYTVLVDVKGYLSNLEVTLASSPSLPREDIISLIATGLTQEEIRESGRTQRSLGAKILAGEISGVIDRPVAKTTGLDRFRLEASESGRLSRVTVGKNVTDRLTLGYTQDFAPESAERTVEANYYLTDNILLKGFRTREAGLAPRYQFNISFRFRLR